MFVAKRRKPSRPAPLAPLRCHVVDDHCDALKHIHAAIRCRALPFEGVSMMHWDAHPDLMVPIDMPADTCYSPRELYDELSESEGGIAEWILPMVYQGHLSKLWWIRPPWARQFVDGNYRFSVGKVVATGTLRVSSTAPYFVDDRLHCPEDHMQSCKPVHLTVSLAHDGDIPVARDPATAKKKESGEACEPETSKTQALVKPVRPINPQNVVDVESTGNIKEVPWVLDICLDYFTCENPFILELELRIGKVDADLVRNFFEKPLFRGPTTTLPHDVQVEHERLFKSEVERLLDSGADVSPSQPESNEDVKHFARVGDSIPPLDKVPDQSSIKSSTLGTEDEAIHPESVGVPREIQEDERRGRRLQSLNLFSKDDDDHLLPIKFAALVGRMGPAERKLIAWVDHCVCLPRYLATREEVRESVLRAERLLSAEMSMAGSGDWVGRPGVVTVARSSGDGYVPSDMVGFVEGEVLAMLERLFGDGADPAIGRGGLKVLYEEGLEYAEG